MALSIMPPALFTLLGLRARAAVRRSFRGIRTPKGALVCLLGVGMLIMWLGPTIAISFTTPPSDGHTVRSMAPVALLAFCFMNLLTAGPDSGLTFRAAEVDFLFAGPFNRRQLLIFKLVGSAMGSLFVAAFMSIFLLQITVLWLAAFIGAFLSVMFIQLVHMIVVLTATTVAQRSYTRGRRIVLAVVAVAVAVGLGGALAGGNAGGFSNAVTQFRLSWTGAVVLAPFEVFGHTLAAARYAPDLVGWGAAALAIDLAMAALVIRMDANFLESSAAASERLYERVQRARRGNAPWSAGKARGTRWQVPLLPWLGGAGPIAWRQINTAVRGARGIIIMLVIFGASFSGFALAGDVDEHATTTALFTMGGVSFFFLPQVLTFDFRSDVDRMDVLKALPIRPIAVVLGQLIAPVAFASAVQWVMVVAMGVLGGVAMPMLIAAALFVAPLNLLVFAVENLVFLHYPHRMSGAGLGDIQAFGRQMLTMLVKMMCLGVALGVAAGVGGVAYVVAGKSLVALAAGAWVTTAACGAAMLPALAAAYQRFDPSTQTPP